MRNSPPNSSETADREIVITRDFDAPRELVWEAWTDPQHVIRWWGPNGFTNTFHEMDVRPGGVWRFIMHGPDGTDYPNRIVYLEIIRPERIEFDHGADDDGPPHFRVTVTFTELNGGTRVTLRQLFETTEQRDRTLGFGAVEGGRQTLNRLAEYLQTMRNKPSNP